jgi:HK97 family phage prohead protease
VLVTPERATAPEFKDIRATLKADEDGAFRAVFSTFGVVDLDGDVTSPDAFTKGAEVWICAWGHNWGEPPVGVGVIDADETAAWVDGRFLLETPQGEAHYRTVKAGGSIQEWSYGFQVLQSHSDTVDDVEVRVLDEIQVFEVSPVHRAAGIGTHTEAIKGLTFAKQSDMALTAVRDFVERAKALTALREKSGRTLSSVNRDRLNRHLDVIREVASDIEELLASTEPADDPAKAALVDVTEQWLRYQAIRARALGVPV